MEDFSKIIGHTEIVNHMKQAIATGKVSHAYIFEGEDLSGKQLLARIFAKALQCEKKDGTICGTCLSCQQADEKSQPDIIFVKPEKTMSIGVDDIRTQVVSDMGIKPYSSPYKIYIIDEADTMTQQAQNALLKTIEEPPEYGIIMLLANNAGRFLPTILSRCIKLSLRPIDTQLIRTYLREHYELENRDLEFCTQFAWGNLGKGIRLASSPEFHEIKDSCINMLSYIDEMPDYEIIDYIKSLSKYKLRIYDYIDLMKMWFRDVLLLKVTKNPNELVFKEQFSILKKQGELTSYEGIESILKAMDNAKVRLRANVGLDITLELLLFTIKENF